MGRCERGMPCLSAKGSGYCCRDAVTIPIEQTTNAFFDLYMVSPTEIMEFAHIGEFARCAVRLGRIKLDGSVKPDGLGYQYRQIADGEFFARSHVDVAIANLS